jgi:hypothetical protein
MMDDREVIDLRRRMVRVERELHALPVRVPRGAASSIIVQETEGGDTLYSGGGFTVTGISDDSSSTPSMLPQVSPNPTLGANLGRARLRSTQAYVWVATRFTVDGQERGGVIGDVPDDELCLARPYRVPVAGGGEAMVYVMEVYG